MIKAQQKCFENVLHCEIGLDVFPKRMVSFNLFRFDSHLFQAFENAVTVMYALGGSTNAVLHLLALAHE